eukprot:675144-Pleurochrysis_carterae.AAC.11
MKRMFALCCARGASSSACRRSRQPTRSSSPHRVTAASLPSAPRGCSWRAAPRAASPPARRRRRRAPRAAAPCCYVMLGSERTHERT